MKKHNDKSAQTESADENNVKKEKLAHTALQGERVSIRNFEAGDYQAFAELFADEDVLYFYLPGKLQTYRGDALAELLADWNDLDTSFVFTVLQEDKPIGLITCESVDFDMGHLETGIALISVSERSRGLATEAMNLFIAYLFQDLGLHRINARIIGGNAASVKLFQRLGFEHEGLQREFVRRGSTYLDMNLFGLLEQDWQLKKRN
ncbi:MAG: GNAT family protein [Saccharofermentanales bacterium]|jgi:RimJ/RimL family protein N-acetyltransferase|nr:GNAT family protein [Eubacteriales bacterium]MDD3611271.1 GNAT family protein [Eubacteriales bacterium]HHU04618.1 GNAT family N-acetyltransferase [Fastidiosipila sp.]